MLMILGAVLCGIFSIIAGKAGKRGFSLMFGFLGVLLAVAWFNSGPGHTIINWWENPSVEVPDNIPIPGQGK